MAVAGIWAPVLSTSAIAKVPDKRLNFFNTHTGETYQGVFWTAGQFLPDALTQINRVLRDHRSNTIAEIDTNLLNLISTLSAHIGTHNPIHIISGYRSPETNQWLADRTDGVASHSLHLDGKAIDLRIPGIELTSLKTAATRLGGGGVGYYPKSQFIHLDTGRVRTW